MLIAVLGINHKSAELCLREKLAKEASGLFDPAHYVHPHFSFVLLSTCNRTEIYFHSKDLAVTHTYILNAIREKIEEEFEHSIYSYFGSDCFLHLARVTAGVDSALIGETEIQGQVKRAYEKAHAFSPLPFELHFLFQKSLKIGKEARSQRSYGLPSIAEAILSIGERLLGSLRETKILFVGLSEINKKVLYSFKKAGCRSLFLCNRTPEKSAEIVKKEGVGFWPWEQLGEWPSFEMALFGTKCPDFLATQGDLFPGAACQLIIDLSVPRNVDPKMGYAVTLLNIDHINRSVDKKRRGRALECARYEAPLIAHSVERQLHQFHCKTHYKDPIPLLT